jgi:CRISPR-associated exonuclease Cas4
MVFLLLVSVVLVIAAFYLLRRGKRGLTESSREKQALRLPEEAKVVFQDRGLKQQSLVVEDYDLVGKPDLVLEENGFYIPVELKTGRSPRQPYDSHVMQLMAYCLLLESHYEVRPPHGLLRFTQDDKEFRIAYTPEREAQLKAILERMKTFQEAEDVHRNHRNANKCRACSFFEVCAERLEPGS